MKGEKTMNPRVEKLRAEREKNDRKIQSLQSRNKTIDEKVTKIENTDIIGLVREVGMTPDQLAELLKRPGNPDAEGLSTDVDR